MLMEPYCGRKHYDPRDMIFIKNPDQAGKLAKYTYLYDTFVSGVKLVYAFNRKEAEPYMEKWRNYELE